ncbi:hypothetical protein MTO96_020873 [Rhipicephalus appendiculatus]
MDIRPSNGKEYGALSLEASPAQKNAHTEMTSKSSWRNEPQLDKSWSRAVIACAATFFSSAVHSTSGFFYVAFMRQYEINRQAASWPTSVFQAVDDVSGAGSGIVSVAVTMIMLMYFDKYRGFATGVRYAGYSLSSLLYPPILALLDEAFPFRQMMLLFGAISLHMTPLVLTLKEPPWAQKSSRPKRPNGEEEKSSTDLDCPSVQPDQAGEKKNHRKNIRESSTVNTQEQIFKISDSSDNVGRSGSEAALSQRFKPMRRATNGSIVQNNTLFRRASEACGYITNTINHRCTRERLKTAQDGINDGFPISRISVGDSEVDAATQPYKARFVLANTRSSICATDSNPAENSSESLTGRATSRVSLFLKPTFWAVVLGGVLADYTDCAFMATIVDSALDHGGTRYQADLSIACSAPSQLLGRAVLPLIADMGFINRVSLSCACYFLFGACIAGLAMTSSFVTYAPCMALASLFMGCLTTMKHVVTADYFGVDVVPVAWAATGVVLLPMLIANPSILGFFRDKQGAYDNLYYVLGSLHLIMGTLFIVLLCSNLKRQKKWTPKARETEAP